MRNKIVKLYILIILGIFLVAALLPFYIMIIMSTHFSEDLFKGIVLFPGNYIVENFRTISEGNFEVYYMNSIFVSVLAAFGSVLFSSMAGYGFSKFEFKFKTPLFIFVLATLMIPVQLGLVAFVVQMRYLGWINTHWPLIIPPMANSFGVFWMTQYMKSSIPKEVIENARVEGCPELRLFLQIIVPYSRPALITLGLLVFLHSWNNYIVPLVVLQDSRLYTLPLGVAMLSAVFRVDYSAQIMALSIGTIPLLLIFLAGRKYFISGMTAGAVKG